MFIISLTLSDCKDALEIVIRKKSHVVMARKGKCNKEPVGGANVIGANDGTLVN